MRSSTLLDDMIGAKASARVRSRLLQPWNRAFRKRHREPEYGGYDSYLRRSLGYRPSGILTPTPQFETEEDRLGASIAARNERLGEIVGILKSLTDEVMASSPQSLRDITALCDLMQLGPRPALTTVLLNQLFNDIGARVLYIQYALDHLDKDGTAEFLKAGIMDSNRLSSQLADFDLTNIPAGA